MSNLNIAIDNDPNVVQTFLKSSGSVEQLIIKLGEMQNELNDMYEKLSKIDDLNNVVLGRGATAGGASGSTKGCVSIGKNAEVTDTSYGFGGVAIGGSASSSYGGAAIGTEAKSSSGFAGGRSAEALKAGSIAIGENTSITGTGNYCGVAIGSGAKVYSERPTSGNTGLGSNISIGDNSGVGAKAQDGTITHVHDSIALGHGTKVSGNNSIGIGSQIKILANNSIGIGNQGNIPTDNTIRIGNENNSYVTYIGNKQLLDSNGKLKDNLFPFEYEGTPAVIRGDDGRSAFQIAKDNNYIGQDATEAQWLDSLQVLKREQVTSNSITIQNAREYVVSDADQSYTIEFANNFSGISSLIIPTLVANNNLSFKFGTNSFLFKGTDCFNGIFNLKTDKTYNFIFWKANNVFYIGVIGING